MRGGGVACLDGVGHAAVRADGLLDELFARNVDKEGNGCLEHTHQARDDEVAAALGNGVVECGVGGGVVLTGLGQALRLIAELADAHNLIFGRVLGGHARHLRLDHKAHLEQVARQALLVADKGKAQRVVGDAGVRCHVRARTLLDAHDVARL